ncbi:protein FAM151B isoform X2 [Episyrphus balteatus]|uniref:protein FAM151B isoform X2 n=1 Tax=Episyrphus balteatus TaxID=286459 RepID=UPI0024862D56|nr:protein FAM151B isoform X2 [Episyrphus balteatus]
MSVKPLNGFIGTSLANPYNTSIYVYEIINSDKSMKPTENNNLTSITWAHAVNSQKELDDALKSDIDMIEADIVLGKINNTGPDLPVMGHPPKQTSDISLESFLRQILDFNNKTDHKKGVKLDFKSIEVFEGSLALLHGLWSSMTYPIWLNADIIKGPVNNTETVPVDPTRFFAGCKDFPDAVLSIGWTTRWGSDFKDGFYTDTQIEEMVDSIKKNNITDSQLPITFPVRAGIAASSDTQLHWLLRAVNETNPSTLTIWSSANDNVDIKKLRKLIFDFGLNRVYLDVPEEVSSKLNLHKGPGNAAALPSIFNVAYIGLCALVASYALQKTFS